MCGLSEFTDFARRRRHSPAVSPQPQGMKHGDGAHDGSCMCNARRSRLELGDQRVEAQYSKTGKDKKRQRVTLYPYSVAQSKRQCREDQRRAPPQKRNHHSHICPKLTFDETDALSLQNAVRGYVGNRIVVACKFSFKSYSLSPSPVIEADGIFRAARDLRRSAVIIDRRTGNSSAKPLEAAAR